MEKIIGAFETTVTMSDDEAKEICNLGKGDRCCAFLAMGGGFQCIRMTSNSEAILKRLNDGTMNAKGKGGWDKCAWQGEIEYG